MLESNVKTHVKSTGSWVLKEFYVLGKLISKPSEGFWIVARIVIPEKEVLGARVDP